MRGLLYGAIWFGSAAAMYAALVCIPFVRDTNKRRTLIVLYFYVFPVLGIIPVGLLLDWFDAWPDLSGEPWSIKLLVIIAWVAVPHLIARFLDRLWNVGMFKKS